MPVGVGVGKETSLEHLVHGGLHAWDEMSRREGGLLNILVIVGGVAVKDQFPDRHERIVGVRPNLGDVENIPFVFEAFFLRHDLNEEVPLGCLLTVQVVEEVPLGIIRIFSSQLSSPLRIQVLHS